MKSVVFKAAGQPLAVEERPEPKPAPGQVILKVNRCGVCGTDVQATSGRGMTYAPDSGLGHEFSAEVVEITRGVTQLKVGDRVTAMAVMGCAACPACLAGDPFWCTGVRPPGSGGAFAEFCLSNESVAVKLPTNVSLEDAALTEPLCCGLHGISRARMPHGARVLIIGAGAIAHGTIYWARRLGARRIAVLSRSNRGEALSYTMGADYFSVPTDSTDQDVAEALGGRPDIVFECSGAVGTLERSVELVRPRGVVVVLGFCSVPDSFLPSAALLKEVDVRFAIVYNRKDFEYCLDAMNADFVPRALLTRTVGFSDFPGEFEALRQGGIAGKLTLDPSKT